MLWPKGLLLLKRLLHSFSLGPEETETTCASERLSKRVAAFLLTACPLVRFFFFPLFFFAHYSLLPIPAAVSGLRQSGHSPMIVISPALDTIRTVDSGTAEQILDTFHFWIRLFLDALHFWVFPCWDPSRYRFIPFLDP